MKILLADSDRDLLQSYEKLLTMDGHQVTTAFDGAQVVSLLAGGPYDIAVLEEKLPRIGGEQLLQLLRREGVPAILLLDERVSVKRLLRADLPEAYLSFPFLPADLTGLLESTARKLATETAVDCGGVAVDAARFRFAGTQARLTVQEIDLMEALARHERPQGRQARTIIHALNEKLWRLGRGVRIEYELEKGYKLVSNHE
ncbi:MAG: response regulator transcription factor [Clostridia bacterium]|nr:response regulator transcription factor [Clostridia bacterium]